MKLAGKFLVLALRVSDRGHGVCLYIGICPRKFLRIIIIARFHILGLGATRNKSQRKDQCNKAYNRVTIYLHNILT